MGEQRNLTEENVETLRKQLEKMKIDNPDLTYRFFEQGRLSYCCHGKIIFNHATGDYCCSECHDRINKDGTKLDTKPEQKSIEERLEAIENKINMIFGDYVLINGQFKDIRQK